MDNYVIIKVGRPDHDAYKRYMQKLEDRRTEGHPDFQKPEELFLYATPNTYMLDTVCRILRQLRVHYTLEKGKAVRKRKSCGASTQSSLTEVSLMLDLQESQSNASENTTPASAKPPEVANGNTSLCCPSETEQKPISVNAGLRRGTRGRKGRLSDE